MTDEKILQEQAEIVYQPPVRAFRRFLHNAFVVPFQHPSRSFMYFISFLFALGFAFIDVFVTIDVAGLGISELMAFLLTKFAFTGGTICGLLLLMGRMPEKAYYMFLIAISLGGICYVLAHGGTLSPAEAGTLYGLLVGPFWSMYHVMFAAATSDENIGNEVSLAGTGMTVGITLGSIAGGLCSQMSLDSWGAILGYTIVGSSTLTLLYRAVKTDFIGSLRQTNAMNETLLEALKRCRYRSVGSLLEGIFNIIGGNLWMVYLRLAGIAAASVGLWQAIMVISKIIVTPFAGALVNHGRRREMMLGAGFNLLGWTPFMFGSQSVLALMAMNVWAVGSHLFSTGLSSAWYGSRTIAAIIMREAIMAVSRLATIVIVTPILYANPDRFIDIAIVVCAVTVIYAALWMKSVRMKGPVLPIENIVTG